MGKAINTNFDLQAPYPIDGRTQVSTYAALAAIPVKYHGLKTYVVTEDKEYRYLNGSWVEITGSSGGGAWGSITGDINTQTDLIAKFALKYDKTGGAISGQVTVHNIVEAQDFIVTGSENTEEELYITSTTTGEPAGSSRIDNAVFISQANYDAADLAGELNANTHYVIKG